jgi:hypothetical protein
MYICTNAAIIKIFLWPMPYFSNKDKRNAYVFSQLLKTARLWFPLKPCTPAGFEPGSFVPWADAMSTAPRLQGKRHDSYRHKCNFVIMNCNNCNFVIVI